MQTKITPNSLKTTITTGYKAVIMSDLHLGMKDCKPSKILEFLDSMRTDILILNGDIIDFDALRICRKKSKYEGWKLQRAI